MSHTTDDDRVIRQGDDRLLVFSEAGLERILADAFADSRESVDDDDAAFVIDTVHERMTDDFYYE